METTVLRFCSRQDADDIMFQFFDGWSQSNTFINAVGKLIVFNSLFIQPVGRFLKNKCRHKHRQTSLDAAFTLKRGMLINKYVPLLRSRSSSGATRQFEGTLRRESSRNRKGKKEKRSSRVSRSPKRTKWSTSSRFRSQPPSCRDQKSHRGYVTGDLSSSRTIPFGEAIVSSKRRRRPDTHLRR